MVGQSMDGKEAIWISAVARGDRLAFQQLYNQTCGRMMAVCLRILGDREQAEDAVQEAFIRIWHGARDYHGDRGAPLAWMLTIGRYAAIDMCRARRSHSDIDEHADDLIASLPDMDDWLAAENEAKALALCLEQLDGHQRESIAMAFYQGLSHEQLARHLGHPLGTVKSWVRRGLGALKRCLGS
jgi:RNA polymerase sigma-70 factor (ECF subfamily)